MRYLHIRNYDGVQHPENLLPHGGVTFAYERITSDALLVARADCSPRDNYNKKIGRAVAAGRLEKGQTQIVKLNDIATPVECIIETLL